MTILHFTYLCTKNLPLLQFCRRQLLYGRQGRHFIVARVAAELQAPVSVGLLEVSVYDYVGALDVVARLRPRPQNPPCAQRVLGVRHADAVLDREYGQRSHPMA